MGTVLQNSVAFSLVFGLWRRWTEYCWAEVLGGNTSSFAWERSHIMSLNWFLSQVCQPLLPSWGHGTVLIQPGLRAPDAVFISLMCPPLLTLSSFLLFALQPSVYRVDSRFPIYSVHCLYQLTKVHSVHTHQGENSGGRWPSFAPPVYRFLQTGCPWAIVHSCWTFVSTSEQKCGLKGGISQGI